MIANGPLESDGPHTGDVDIPAVDLVAVGRVDQKTLLVGASLDHLNLGEADALFVTGRGRNARDHHQLDHLLALGRQLPALGLLETVLGRRDVLVRKGLQELRRSLATLHDAAIRGLRGR